MKFFISAILSAVLLFSLSACGISSEGPVTQNQSQSETSSKTNNSSTTNNSSESSTSQPNTSNNTNNSSDTTNSPGNSTQSQQSTQDSNANTNSSNENNGNEEFFYGQWEIKKVIAYAPAGTYSSEDINTLIGRQLTFSKDHATCFGDKIENMNNSITNPVYKKRVMAKSSFPSNYRVTFDQLGINEDSVTELDVTGTKGVCTVSFITPDNQKLILYGGGTFFELEKVSDQNHSTPSNVDTSNQSTSEENNQSKAVSLVKDYLRDQNELVQDKNHFVLFEETYNNYYIVRYSTLVSGHSSTNGRYAVDIDKGKVTDITDAADLSFLNK